MMRYLCDIATTAFNTPSRDRGNGATGVGGGTGGDGRARDNNAGMRNWFRLTTTRQRACYELAT